MNNAIESIETILTDIGSEFKKHFAKFFLDPKIDLKHEAPYKPTTQGCIERFNRT